MIPWRLDETRQWNPRTRLHDLIQVIGDCGDGDEAILIEAQLRNAHSLRLAVAAVNALRYAGISLEAVTRDKHALRRLVEAAKLHTKYDYVDGAMLSDVTPDTDQRCGADDLGCDEVKKALAACGIEVPT